MSAKALGSTRSAKRATPETETGMQSGSPRQKRRLTSGAATATATATATDAAEPDEPSDSAKSHQSGGTGEAAPLASPAGENCQDTSPKGGKSTVLAAAAAAATTTHDGSDATEQSHSPSAAKSLGSADAPRSSGNRVGPEQSNAEAAAAIALSGASDPVANSQPLGSPKPTVGNDETSAQQTASHGESPHPESPTAKRRVHFACGTAGPEVIDNGSLHMW